MSLSLEYLQQCSAQTGYAIGPLEKVVRLGEIAADITRHPFLGRVLALKGGTALNLCFGSPRRLSVDLDFNYIGHLERNKMLAERPRVEEAIVQLAGRTAYRIQQSADAFAGRKIYLTYRSVTGQNDRIEVDLNFLFRMPVADTVTREMWQPGELDRPTVRMVSLHEIIMGKLLGFLDRSAVRDAWDLAYLPAQAKEVMVSNQFRSWFIALSAILNHPLTDYTRNRIEASVTDRAVAEQLAPMLIGKALLQAGDLVEHSWASIAPLMMLADNEEKYVASIQRGELYPELLFPDDPEEAKRIAAHPAILWKLVNARAHLARSKTKPRRRPSSRGQT
jgi:predicted nucleotidyltransferase component of viral defense system